VKQILASLLETWRQHRQPEVGNLIEAVSATLLAKEPRPAIGATKKAGDRSLWRDVASQQDPLDFPRLVQSARGGSQVDVKLQVQYLSAWNHPSMAKGLLELLENPPYAGIKSRPMLEEIFDALQNTRDVRLVKPARALAKRYLAIVNSGTGGWIVSELERIAKLVSAIVPPPVSAKDHAHYEKIAQSLPLEYRPMEQSTDQSGPDIEALLADVYAHPDDDEKRLNFAKAIEKEDPERGEFIQLQIAVTRGTLTPEQQARLKALSTPAKMAGWAQPISMSGQCDFARGFPSAIRLYKTALKSIEEKGWATIEQIDGIGGLSQKVAVELLDHPNLANIKRLSSISSKVLAALEDRPRPWIVLSLAEDTLIDKQLLQRIPKVHELSWRLHATGAIHDPQVLWALGHLQILELRVSRELKKIDILVPPTVTEANIHGEIVPGTFAHAKKLKKLTLWPDRLEKSSLEGLSQLESLDLRADEFDADIFEAAPAILDLKISLTRSNGCLPRGILRPLTKLKSLDLSYSRLELGELEPLEQLEEVHNHWLDIEGVPVLPNLRIFHCMLPSRVVEIERVLERNPSLRQMDFCWNSSSDLWFYGEAPAKVIKPWERFTEAIKKSPVESWGCDNKVRVVRQKDGWRIDAAPQVSSYDYGLEALVRKIMEMFEISQEQVAPILVNRSMKR